MSVSSRGAASPAHRTAPTKWLFTKEEMKKTASIQEGMSREEELASRQMAAAFIQEMIDGLNNVKDPKMKIGHTGLCVAHTHMHRFYYLHSFKKYDYRDVGAACVFLAGKSQECPRKLSHVISVWRERKDRKQLTTETARNEAAQIIVLLESMILQTIAFDLNVHLPHIYVLDIMKKVDKKEHYRPLTSCAYYFATDVIAVTDWSLRYSAASMSIVIIHLMAAYANVRIERLFADFINEDSPWYAKFDETMTNEKLREMEVDFLVTYRNSCQFHHASKFNFREHRPMLENPDVRKLDRTRDARSHSPMVHHVPDSTVNVRPRAYVPRDELTVERLNKERGVEEERRKRERDRMAGKLDSSTSSEKRARIDPLANNFVSSSSSSNGKLAPPPIPPQLNFPPPPIVSSGYNHKNQINRKNHENNHTNSSVSPAFVPSARTFDVAPMLTPPTAPKLQSADNSDMDLEDGELE
ncbi:Cyclin-T1.1 [Caenorhabditis elegans]|uniref:Cyclin-T1.1 n=1 Tax=Caenorhabditis elegans TaxID=6239 RepID=CCNT1_CAEEL|nr:Cyclin-T1.1 [Caenorhabditis elegans]P34425.1 RecName: Full=Cyclin-T1.1 [Caenorhabditis elegans]CCD63445.1 Cyclin-T1.1 [Caenorhabditis elegans]|eukprot:NP_498744.1 Cyclin-T1.1 [Caenorhabditis elegans]